MAQKKKIAELTNSQIGMVDEIDRLLLKLYKAGVKPIIVDGGGGNGLRFIRCSNDALDDVCDAILYNEDIHIGDDVYKVDDFVYNPKNSYKYVVTHLVP